MYKIPQDPEAVLFTPCGRQISDTKDICTNPIIKGFQNLGCKLHSIALVSEPKPPDDELEKMKSDFTEFPFAESEVCLNLCSHIYLQVLV